MRIGLSDPPGTRTRTSRPAVTSCEVEHDAGVRGNGCAQAHTGSRTPFARNRIAAQTGVASAFDKAKLTLKLSSQPTASVHPIGNPHPKRGVALSGDWVGSLGVWA